MITGGKVTFRTPSTFESKTATVELIFDHVSDAEEAAAKAVDLALRMAGIRPSVDQKAQYAASTATAAINTGAPEKEPKRAGRPPKKGEEAPKANGADDDIPIAGAAKTVTADNIMGDDDDLYGASADAAKVVSEITDDKLKDAVTKTQEKINNVPAIRELIGKYIEPKPGVKATVVDIPQGKRAEFVEKLKELPKGA